jgi:hypothetical protein
MLSTTQMIRRLQGMVGSKDLSDWESGFVESLAEKFVDTDKITKLSERQLEVLERLHGKHFG